MKTFYLFLCVLFTITKAISQERVITPKVLRENISSKTILFERYTPKVFTDLTELNGLKEDLLFIPELFGISNEPLVFIYEGVYPELSPVSQMYVISYQLKTRKGQDTAIWWKVVFSLEGATFKLPKGSVVVSVQD